MHGPASARTSLVSDFAHDPSMREVIKDFVARLPIKVNEIREGVVNGDTVRVRRLTHQLAGVADGYGFPQIGEAANCVERALDSSGGPEPDVSRAAVQIDELIEHCLSAACSSPGQDEPGSDS